MFAQVVEFGMIALADQTAFLEGEGRVIDERSLNGGTDFRTKFQGGFQFEEPLRARAVSRAFKRGNRASVRASAARSRGSGAAGADAGRKPFQVVGLRQDFAQVVARSRVARQFGDRVEPLADGHGIG